MKPETILFLRKEIPALHELIDFLRAQAAALNTLTGLDVLPAEERAIEATARLRAKERLDAILAPLIGTEDIHTSTDPKEYVVDV